MGITQPVFSPIMIFSGEFPGAAVDRARADGAPGDALPHAGQHLHQRHRALPKVGPGQCPPGRQNMNDAWQEQ